MKMMSVPLDAVPERRTKRFPRISARRSLLWTGFQIPLVPKDVGQGGREMSAPRPYFFFQKKNSIGKKKKTIYKLKITIVSKKH